VSSLVSTESTALAQVDSRHAGVSSRRPGPDPAHEVASYEEAISALDQVTFGRRARLQQSQEGLPGLFQVLIVSGPFLLIADVPAWDPQPGRGAAVRRDGRHARGVQPPADRVLDYPFAGASRSTPIPSPRRSSPSSGRPTRSARPPTTSSRPRPRTWSASGPRRASGWPCSARWAAKCARCTGWVGGSIVGSVSDGVFRGWWCEGPTRSVPDAGDVEFRSVRPGTALPWTGGGATGPPSRSRRTGTCVGSTAPSRRPLRPVRPPRRVLHAALTSPSCTAIAVGGRHR
jgi:hypothetical protein